MSDHPETNHGAIFEVTFVAKVGQQELEEKQAIKVIRNGEEKADLDITVTVPDIIAPIPSGESFKMHFALEHNNASKAEPVNAIIRVFLPPYIEFDDNPETRIINATNLGEITFNTDKGGLDIILPQFLFTDTVNGVITLISDPQNKRGHGRGEINATTPYRVLCKQTFRQDPSPNPEADDLIISCGPVDYVSYPINSLECFHALGISDASKITDCQISASSAAKRETGPQFVRMGSERGWSPALRFGMTKQYLQIDFLQTSRVAGIEFYKVEGTRAISKYRIMHSYDGLSWSYANEVTEVIYSENKAMSNLTKPIQTRFIRLIIEEAELIEEEETKYIGVQIELFGCFIGQKSPSATCSNTDETWYSDDKRKFGRHFSVDTERDVLYFCDFEYNTLDLGCFATSDAGQTWKVLPKNIGGIVGYDEESKMIYAVDKRNRAYMGSDNSEFWLPITFENANKTIGQDSFVLSHSVPAFTSEDISNLNAKLGKWQATFKGLVYEDQDKPKAFWSKCCTGN